MRRGEETVPLACFGPWCFGQVKNCGGNVWLYQGDDVMTARMVTGNGSAIITETCKVEESSWCFMNVCQLYPGIGYFLLFFKFCNNSRLLYVNSSVNNSSM